MDAEAKPKGIPHSDALGTGLSQAIFIAVGLAIVVGGLWLLYSAGGPYHPGGETQVYLSEG